MMTRKKFLKRLIQLSVIGAVPALYSWQIEPFWLEFVHKKMPIKNLPNKLQGKTLMQVSDLHLGSLSGNNFLQESFEKAKKINPDFVVYTGDFVNWGGEPELDLLRKVSEHFVHGTLGTLGVLGNHDYGKRWKQNDVAEKIVQITENAGIKMLLNTQIEISGLNFIGFEDLWSERFFPENVMEDYDSNKANLVLCHNPDACDKDIWNGYKGWILSGHTHGGQCRIPKVVTPILPVKNKRYTSGEIDLNDGRKLYINRALGHSHQVRFMVRPEITVFTLEKI